MAFMQNTATYGTFHQFDTRHEGIVSMPAEYFTPEQCAKDYGVDVDDIETITGWFARLSAPGYMDCTEWQGPYDSKDEAIAALVDTYGEDEE